MALIKNAVVKMDWDSEGFYESKKNGTFVAAVNVYKLSDDSDFPVIFIGGKACILWDPDYNRPVSRDEFTELLADLVKEYGDDLDLENIDITAEAYIEVSNGVTVDGDIVSEYGLDDEIQKDIINRIEDLSGYYVVEYEDMI